MSQESKLLATTNIKIIKGRSQKSICHHELHIYLRREKKSTSKRNQSTFSKDFKLDWKMTCFKCDMIILTQTWTTKEIKVYIKSPVCFPLAAVSSPATPCLLTWQHVMLCQVLSPKKSCWTERSEKHAHKGMWTAFSLWHCFNQSQMQLQSENTSDLLKQQWTLALSKTCRICGSEGTD